MIIICVIIFEKKIGFISIYFFYPCRRKTLEKISKKNEKLCKWFKIWIWAEMILKDPRFPEECTNPGTEVRMANLLFWWTEIGDTEDKTKKKPQKVNIVILFMSNWHYLLPKFVQCNCTMLINQKISFVSAGYYP